MNDEHIWRTVIKPKTGWFDIDLKEIVQYSNLIIMFVKRNVATYYKQTVLGPLWFIINPLLTTVVFTVVFGKIANLSTDGIPQFLFYLAGNTVWLYFSNCITSTSNTFTQNVNIFSKVYFPRLTMPIATVIYGAISFVIQYGIFIIALFYYLFIRSGISPNIWILITPLLIIQVAALGLGIGIIISSLTTKYRDLQILVSFGVQLLMYATPVVYPLSSISDKYKFIISLNPMTPIIETFRYAYLGCGEAPGITLIISAVSTLALLTIGIIIFSHIEKTFADTV